MRIALLVVAVLIVAAGLQLLLETARHSTTVATQTGTASAMPSVAVTPTSAGKGTPTPTPTASVPTPTPPPPPTVTISGAGSGHSRVFTLNDTVGYLARYTLGSSCQYDGPLPVGNFYVGMTTGRGCSWSVTFTPR